MRMVPPASVAFDAAPILGLGKVNSEPLPDPVDGEIVVRVGEWSFEDLCIRNGATVLDRVRWNREFYKRYRDGYAWSTLKTIPGIYRVRIPIPSSGYKSISEQRDLLFPDEELLPIALAASVSLCCLQQFKRSPIIYDGFKWGSIRCAEILPQGCHILLTPMSEGMFADSYPSQSRDDSVWLAGCRKIA
jgi:hypothetical protein